MVQEKFLHVDGSRIRYLESGSSGDTLVLIHGLGASAERWDQVIPLLEDGFRLIVPDLVGFGYSDKPLVDYTPEFFLDFMEKFFVELGISRPSIIGSSLGGQIAAEYASANPNNIGRLILVSPAGIMKKSTPALDAYIMAALYPNKESAQNAFSMMEGSGRPVPRRIVDGFVERMRLPNAKLAFMSTLLGLKNAESIEPKLANISAPTLIVWGSKDPVIPISHADDFISAIQNCKFSRMEGYGHAPYAQDPHLFASRVLDFLNGVQHDLNTS